MIRTVKHARVPQLVMRLHDTFSEKRTGAASAC